MKRNIILLCILTMLGLMIYTNIDHILWLRQHSNIDNNWNAELFPLLINNIIWICLIPLYLIWKTKKEIALGVFILMIATTTVQITTTIYSRLVDDPLAAGLPFVIITIPISILLLIFAVKELRAK